MHRFLATYLGAFIFSWLLSLGSHVAWGYYPPLQATASYTTHSVTYSVYNPEKQQGYSATLETLGTVVDLQQHNGVIAWVVQYGTTYDVSMVTFDPVLNTFQGDTKGPFHSVGHFNVMDGLVAYSIIDMSGNPGYGCATYDPDKGTWQYDTDTVTGGITLTLDVINQDGVVVYKYYNIYSGGHFSEAFNAQLYDAKIGAWSNQAIEGCDDISMALYVSNATVYWRCGTGGTLWFCGYVGMARWEFGETTAPVAYFVAQPKLGTSPLWVWFTDMSIGGTTWNWNFDDNSGSTNRSPHHTFTSPGTFWVSLQINGPSFAYTQPIIVGNPSVLKGKSLPAILELLLLAD